MPMNILIFAAGMIVGGFLVLGFMCMFRESGRMSDEEYARAVRRKCS